MGRAIILAFVLTTLVLLASCGQGQQKRLDADLQDLHIAHLNPKDVKVNSVEEQGGNEAIVEAEIHTTFLMKKNAQGKWEIQSVRLGDRQWEDAKLFAEAYNEAKAKQVHQDFDLFASAIDKYVIKTHHPPSANSIVEINDLLYPDYLPHVLRLDPWSKEYEFRMGPGESFTLISAGPDRKFGTADDIQLVRQTSR